MRFPGCASSAACRRFKGDRKGKGTMSAKRLRVYHGKRKAARWLWLLLPLAALLGVGLFWRYDMAAPSRTRTVEILLEAENGEPAADMPVSALIDTTAVPIGRWGEGGTLTGADGRCRFEGMAPGSYWLRAADNLYEVRIPENAPSSLSLTLSTAPDRYTLVLRLQDAQGEPAARRPVTLLETELEKAAAASFSQTVQGETDWQGNLVFENLRAGGHLLCPEGAAPIALVIEPNEKKTVSSVLRVYPEQAEPVLQELLLYGQNARPLKNEPVAHVLYALPGGREILLSEQETDEAGRLSLSLLSPGSYTLRIQNRRLKLEAQGGGQIQSVYL